jgi:hypothetical protein
MRLWRRWRRDAYEFDFSMFGPVEEMTAAETCQAVIRRGEAIRAGTAVVHRHGVDPFWHATAAMNQGKYVLWEFPGDAPGRSNGYHLENRQNGST